MNFINGEWLQASGQEIQSVNPANHEILWHGRESQAADVNIAVEAAAGAFDSWTKTPLDEKLCIFEKFRELLQRDKESFARIISDESGKPYWECLTEVGAMMAKLAISIQANEERCHDSVKELPGNTQSVTRFRPIGPMAVFGPFNLPVHLPNGHIIPALISGNTLIFKPSEQTPLCAEKMVRLWQEAGIPNGVLNLVQGSKITGMALTSHEHIKGVLFTGSYNTGAAIHKALAGKPEIMLALELGGNNPLVVWDVEDLKAAAYITVQSAFITSGQRCVCARRLIIPNGPDGDKFIEELVQLSVNIGIGLPRDEEEPFMGPLISSQAASICLKSQSELVHAGAKVILEMRQNERCDALVSPGIIDVTKVTNRPDEEIFGPLLQVIRVDSYEEALTEADRTEFGLSAGLISDSRQLYEEFLLSSKAGIINWNRQITGAVSSAPFGGSGKSGNFRPGAYLAADYCAYPVASIESSSPIIPETLSPGLTRP